MDQQPVGQACPCPHHKMVPIFLVLLGLAFLLNALNVLSTKATMIIWPILLILIGLQKLFQSKCTCCNRDR